MKLNGLTSQEVAKKIKEGKTNHTRPQKTNSITSIIGRNTFTIFNLVNLILATMVLIVGSYKNLLFIFIAIANTLIAIINEIRAKRTIDKMKLLSEQKPTVIRDGKTLQIAPSNIVEGDLLVFGLGDQIMVDAEIKEGIIEVNESFITGEQSNIAKHPGDQLISGSFVVAGTCKAVATAVGQDSYITKLETSAHTIKPTKSKLFLIMNNIVKWISFGLIPIGALLLWSRFRVDGESPEIAVTSTVAALINMIPEGLILLTSSVLALSTIRLSRQKVLVQDLYAIETLARVDCIALDKTGTLTTGKMIVKDLIPIETQPKNALNKALALILSHSSADTATSLALKEKLLQGTKFEPTEQIEEVIPFSSDRKYSGVRTKKSTYLMGAPEVLLDSVPKEILNLATNYRVIAVVKLGHSPSVGTQASTSARNTFFEDRRFERASLGVPEAKALKQDAFLHTALLGFVTLEDELRPNAKQIVDYFYQNDIDIKIISGDNKKTVQTIAKTAGVKHTNLAIDLSTLNAPINYRSLVKKYTIFARVTPSQKKHLILALKKQGKTVAMTGDGVNDILAMKEADCSIAIGDGADAARQSAKFVLLNSGFSAVPSIIDEGRQTVNNLERSTALFLAKTVYASILAILFVFLPLRYPFTPIEMSLLNFACIGFPAFVLAFEKNTDRIKNHFTRNIVGYSVPIGLTVSICVLALSVISHVQDFSHFELTTTSAFVTFAINLMLIYWISRPLNALRAGLLLTIISIMVLAFVIPFVRSFFEFSLLSSTGLLVTIIIIAIGIVIFTLMRHLMKKVSDRIFDQKS